MPTLKAVQMQHNSVYLASPNDSKSNYCDKLNLTFGCSLIGTSTFTATRIGFSRYMSTYLLSFGRGFPLACILATSRVTSETKRTGQSTNTYSSKDDDGFEGKWRRIATDSPYREWTAFTVPLYLPDNSLHTRHPCQVSAYKIATEHLHRNSMVCCRLHTLQREDDQYQMCTRKIMYNILYNNIIYNILY